MRNKLKNKIKRKGDSVLLIREVREKLSKEEINLDEMNNL